MHPEVTLLGAAPAGVEHRRGGLVDEQLGRAQQLLAQQPPQRLQLGRRIADPEGQCRPVDRDALARQDLGTGDRAGEWSAYLATTTWATSRSVGRPPSISRAGAGACTIAPWQARQAYFGRRVTMT